MPRKKMALSRNQKRDRLRLRQMLRDTGILPEGSELNVINVYPVMPVASPVNTEDGREETDKEQLRLQQRGLDLLGDILPVSYEYRFTEVDSVSTDDNCEATFRMKLVSKEEVKEWLTMLQEKSIATWRVAQTFPGSGRKNLFKKHFRCHHNTDKRSLGVKSSKNTNCQAKIKIVVKRYVERSKSIRVDPLTQEWPCIIEFNNKHNHSLKSASVLKYRDMSEETKQKLLDLFHQGHSPSSALHCLKTDLHLEHGEDYLHYNGDGRYVPSLSIVGHLYDSEFKDKHVSQSQAPMLNDLQKYLEEYSSKTGGKAIYGATFDGHTYVCICTPIMVRVHKLVKETSDVVYVDAASGMDRQRHRVYLLTTSSPAGGLPLGIIICDGQREAVFDEALKELIENCLPENSFYGQNYPTVIITDNDLRERISLQTHFSGSWILLCQFHVLKAMWLWLCNTKNGIEKDESHELFFLFKSVVYSRTEDELQHTFDYLIQDNEVAKKYPQYLKYVEKSWQEREAWASCYRSALPIRGSHSTNYVEVAFRILKDSILEKVMAFNLMQLVELLLTRYESYIEKRLLCFAHGCLQKSPLKRFPHVNSNMSLEDIGEYESETRSDCFTVPCETEDNAYYTVDISRCICECSLTGALCKHIYAVFEKLNMDNIYVSRENARSFRKVMFHIATGKESNYEWLLPPARAPTQTRQRQEDEVTPSVGKSMTHLAVTDENSSTYLTSEPEIREEIKGEMKKLYDRVMQGAETNPDGFIPAIANMVLNAKQYASNETGLINALNTFAKYSETSELNVSKAIPKGTLTGVQPTAISKRKVPLARRRKETSRRIAGRPNKTNQADHDYTIFKMPEAKRRAKNDTQTSQNSEEKAADVSQD